MYYCSRNSALLDDLDDLFSAELASIDNLLDAQQSKEKKAEERQIKETEELKVMEKKAMEVRIMYNIVNILSYLMLNIMPLDFN